MTRPIDVINVHPPSFETTQVDRENVVKKSLISRISSIFHSLVERLREWRAQGKDKTIADTLRRHFFSKEDFSKALKGFHHNPSIGSMDTLEKIPKKMKEKGTSVLYLTNPSNTRKHHLAFQTNKNDLIFVDLNTGTVSYGGLARNSSHIRKDSFFPERRPVLETRPQRILAVLNKTLKIDALQFFKEALNAQEG